MDGNKQPEDKVLKPSEIFGEDDFPPAIREKGYHLVKEIGKGAFARVYLATCKKLNDKEIAVKVIILAKVPEEWKKESLRMEMNIIKQLQHQNIIKVWEITKTRRFVFIFMDLAENDTVHGYMQKNRRPCKEKEAQRWFSHILGAIYYIHHRETAHRDLKCENILLDRDHNAKLTDFGFACNTYDFTLSRPILSTTKCGTPAFMAPEVRNPPYDAKQADMWSMGAVLYEMLTFNKPFDEKLPDRKILNLQQKKMWFLPPEIEKRTSQECKDVLQKLLEPSVEKRLTARDALNQPWLRC